MYILKKTIIVLIKFTTNDFTSYLSNITGALPIQFTAKFDYFYYASPKIRYLFMTMISTSTNFNFQTL